MSKKLPGLFWISATMAAAIGLGHGWTPAHAADPAPESSAEPLMLSEGAKAMVCDQLGFLAIVMNSDGTIASPQFPLVRIQHSEGLFALTEEEVEVQGMAVTYTSFLRFEGSEKWVFSGFDGTNPFQDSCRDITGELAFSFAKIAIAASWGMPHIEQRVRLFDAIQDDLQTRLELAGFERDELIAERSQLRDEVDRMGGSLDTLLAAVCEATSGSDQFVMEASYGPGPTAVLPDLAVLRTAATSIGGCLTDTVLTSTQSLPAR